MQVKFQSNGPGLHPTHPTSPGILDKYIGDAAMACFGVPFPSPNDSLRSVSCALRMNEGLEHMNRANVNKGSGKPVLGMGIGICTGKVLSGNIGSDKRMEYTVIGGQYEIPVCVFDFWN